MAKPLQHHHHQPAEFGRRELDKHADLRRVSSPFASISQENLAQHDGEAEAEEKKKQRQRGLGIDDSSYGETLPESDLAASWYLGDDSAGASVGDSGQNSMLGSQELEHDQKRRPSTQEVETMLRERGTSVSFNPTAILDDGGQHTLEMPLPRTGSSRRRARGLSAGKDSAQQQSSSDPGASPAFDPQYMKINPFTGEPVRRRTRKSDLTQALPTLTSQDGANQAGRDGQIASLTSASTVSSPRDEIRTPASERESFMPSPISMNTPGASPNTGSEPWPFIRSASAVSMRSYTSRPGSLRRESRRSSQKSLSGSSPASAFLSKWGKDSLSSVPVEPDDEGQCFGLNNEYVIGRQIGYGGFSVVKEAFTMSGDGQKGRHAVKIVRKSLPDKAEMENEECQSDFEHEVATWRYLQHANVLPLQAVYDTDFATFCVMELISGGSLFDAVASSRKAPQRGLSAKLTKIYAYQLACALRYLHQDMRMVHRDVKLENCLIDRVKRSSSSSSSNHDEEAGVLRLCDFGLADFYTNDRNDIPDMAELESSSNSSSGGTTPTMTASILGSVQYSAPESVRADKPLLKPCVDVWAFGICVYTMAVGDLPFRHAMTAKTIDMISKGVWDQGIVRESAAGRLDGDGIVEVLRGVLEVDADMRWSIADVMGCSWFQGCGDEAF